MIVVDASVVAKALAYDGADGRAARLRRVQGDDLVAPDLVDVETVSVLRWRAGDLTGRRFSVAVDDLADLDLDLARFLTLPLMRRAYELRPNVTAYDAAYVALAEVLDCSVVTAGGLARAPGVPCSIEVIAHAPTNTTTAGPPRHP